MNNTLFSLALIAASGYVLGSVNFALVVSRLLKHDDIRAHGSGNAGMANMLRTFGKQAAMLTALGDLLKTVVAIILARTIVNLSGIDLKFDPGYLAGLFVILGHMFPIFYGFKGGKGVLSALGIILMVNPLACVILVFIALPVFLKFRIISLVSVLCSIALPFVTWGLCLMFQKDPLYESVFTGMYAILVLVAHRKNIKRLLNGTEKPIRIEPKN